MQDMEPETAGLNYVYHMKLSLARPGPPLSEEDRLALEKGAAEYNSRAIYMANPKNIQLLEISDNYIRIKLYSTLVLTTPGRGLRTFTALLLNEPSSRFADRVTPGGQLFRVIDVKQPAHEGTLADPALVSDADLVKALIDYMTEKKDGSASCQKKRAAVEEIKRLAAQAGIIAPVRP